MTLTLTDVAVFRLRTFLRSTANETSDSDQRGVRFSVQDGGCSGYQYALDLVNAPKPDDVLVEQASLHIYVDRNSAPLLEGVVVDYIEGLTQSGFKFSNPNATDTCGCGQSFQAGNCTPTGVPCS